MVKYDPLSAAENGGADIKSYEIQIYNQTEARWQSIRGGLANFTLETEIHITTGIESGQQYLFKYRAWNINGGGEFSETEQLLAASIPSKPE